MTEEFSLGIPGGIWSATLLAGGLALVLAWLRWQEASRPGGTRGRWLFALQCVAALALWALATQPGWTVRSTRTERGNLDVVIDASRSLRVADPENSGAAAEKLARLAQARVLLERWGAEEDDRVRWWIVDQDLRRSENPLMDLGDAQGPGSALWKSMEALMDRAPKERVGAIVLVSDGHDDSSEPAPSELMGVPVHTVVLGSDEALQDESIRVIQADEVAFLHSEAKVQLTLGSTGFPGRPSTLTLSRGDRQIASRAVMLEEEGEVSVELGFEPQELGREVYRVSLQGTAEDQVPQNNERAFLVDVRRDRLRVLHVSGRPSWDQRYLRAFLKRDPSVDLVSFYILRSVHDLTLSDPDELALIPFPTEELFSEHLHSFDVLVLQDFAYRPYRMERFLPLIRDYVMAGGALAMIGGEGAFEGGGYGTTAIADILPVRLEATPAGMDEGTASVVAGKFVPLPVIRHLRHPILELGASPSDSELAFRRLAPLVGAHRFEGLAGSGQALLVHPRHRIGRRPLPILAVAEFGKGRSMALGTDSTWNWGMPTGGARGDASFYDRFWDRAIRWLARDPGLEPCQIYSDAAVYAPGARMRVSGQFRDGEYRALADKGLTLSVRGPHGESLGGQEFQLDDQGTMMVELRAPPRAGVYQLVVPSPESGRGDAPEPRPDMVRLPFVVDTGGHELADVRVMPEALRALSLQTGGRFLGGASGAPDLAALDTTIEERLGRTERRPLGSPWWASGALWLTVLAWIWRRRERLR